MITIKNRELATVEKVCENLPQRIKELLLAIDESLLCDLEEIRLRRLRPLSLTFRKKTLFLCENGSLSVFQNGALCVSELEMDEIFLKFCKHSVYSFQNELQAGFVTLEGGHRVGICGTAVIGKNGEVCGQSDVGTMNIRIARQVRGAADSLIPILTDEKNVVGALIIAPPKCGKTTMLRDLARQLSERCFRVCVIDERGELASSLRGVPQCDVGPCTEVFDGVSKGEGILRALRTMSPEIIIADEIVGSLEAAAIAEAQGCGVNIIASAHAPSYAELVKKPGFLELLAGGAFKKVITLNSKYEVCEVTKPFEEMSFCKSCR